MTSQRAVVGAAIVILIALVVFAALGTPGISTSTVPATAFRALALIGLNLIFGVVGMLAFGQAAFMAMPAYLSGILSAAGIPFPIAACGSVIVVVVVARLVAEVFVRLPGVYLAVGTLGLGMVVEGLARAFPDITGGASGLVFTHGRAVSPLAWTVLSLVLLAAGLTFYVAYVRGATWRRLRAIRHDELSASVIGINVQREKAKAFTLGSAYSAIGGIFLFYFIGVLVPEDAGVVRSLEQIGTVLLGGAGYALGPVVGSFLVDWFFHIAGYTARYETLIYGAIFLLAVIYAPQGAVGLIAQLFFRGQLKPDRKQGGKQLRDGTAGILAGRPELRLSVRRVSQLFGGVHALSDVSFDVRAGEVFTLVGPNGAGKTTLFNIVSGVLSPTSGQIVLNNEDLTHRAVHGRARDIGRSFQTPRLIPELTVSANVLLRIDQLMPRLSERDREALVLAQLRIFELDELADHKVSEISLGQRKLIDIVRACVGNPSLVILDEPAVGLSADELKHLAQVIRTLCAHRSAVVIVEHNIDFLAEIAERGIVLDGGKVIAHGAVREIMTSENVKAAYFGALA